MKEIKLSEYQQLFSTNGMSFLTSDLFMSHYKTLGGLTTFSHDKWTSFLPKATIEKTLKEGVQILSNDDLFIKFKTSLTEYYVRAEEKFKNILVKENLSLEEYKTVLECISENWVYYSKTEFFYIDEAFGLAESDQKIKKNIAELGELKNKARIQMNKIVFEPESYRNQLLRKISQQFEIPFEDLKMYGIADLIKLFNGEKLTAEMIEARERSYIMLGNVDSIEYSCGIESEKIVDGLLASDIKLELKGIIANKGKVTAKATIIKFGDNAFARLYQIIADMPQGNVLVADTTSPELIMACKKASAILTNQGGMMSHAAIVSRELNLPCIVGLGKVTEFVKDGDMVEVDANNGIVKKLS